MESAEAIPLMNGINQAAARPYSYGDMGMGFGGSGALWVILFMAMFGGGGFGFGGGMRDVASKSDVYASQQFEQLQNSVNNICQQLGQNTFNMAQLNQNTNERISNVNANMNEQFGNLKLESYKGDCETQKLVDQAKYELGRQICEGLGLVNANIVAQSQSIKDMMCQNTIQDLRDELKAERTAAAAKQVEQSNNISQLNQNQYLVNTLRPAVVPAIVVGNNIPNNGVQNQPYPGFGFGIGGFGV